MIGLSGLITPSLDEMVHVAREMQRQEINLPLLIGGATTSAKHTAVKIAPQYSQPTIHVLDASRAAGVVEKLLNPERRDELVRKNQVEQKQLVESYQQRQQIKLVPYEEAFKHRFQTDWATVQIDTPAFIGRRVIEDLPLEKLVPLVDWSPFFLTWELKGKYPRIFDDPNVGRRSAEVVRRRPAAARRNRRQKTAHRPRRVWLLAGGFDRRRRGAVHRRNSPARADPVPLPAATMGTQGSKRLSFAGRFHRTGGKWPARLSRRVRRHRRHRLR